MKVIAFLFVILLASSAYAQESRLASDWRREREHIAESCNEFSAKVPRHGVVLVKLSPAK